MIHFKRTATILVTLIAFCINVIAQNDSTYIYLGATDDGNSGLMIYECNNLDSIKWTNRNMTQRITASDFGAWGSGKKMYKPRIFFNPDDNSWHLIFNPDKKGTVMAYTSSPDLIKWSVQEYRYPHEALKMIPSTAVEGHAASYKIKNKKTHGTVFKVSKPFVDNIKNYQRYRSIIDAQNNESTSDDYWRFSGIDTIDMTITMQPELSKKISDKFIGIFFEDINYAADGGLYAELIQNRDFEYSHSERKSNPKWNATTAWSLNDSAHIRAKVMSDLPIHANNPHYLRLTSSTDKALLINNGYDGIPVIKGNTYNISLWARNTQPTSINVSLIDSNGNSIGKCALNLNVSNKWEQLNGTIEAIQSCDSALLTLSIAKTLALDIDMVSLMPQNTFKGHANGLRPDLAQALADLSPRFVRFPGGCVSHGDGLDNLYDWKGSIGKLEARIGKRNLWGYHQTRGLGFYEYFVMCEDLGAEPLPVLAAGVPCQNSSTHAAHSHDTLTGNGQQCGIPMDQMPAYIQDILDLIEYANGDVNTEWGAKRAEAGHPAPFNLKMIGIGNEDLITEAFKTRFLMIHDAIKGHYPEIEVVGTVGPFHEGADYDAGWELAREHNIQTVDEHYYVSPGWLIHNGHYYDSYDRTGTKVYLGEYASHTPKRASTLEAALSTALYLTNVERNADVVTMTSYAPLFAKKNHTQWRPDLIYFDNTSVTLTPDYYVQKMYGNNPGTSYIPSTRTTTSHNADLNVRLGQSIVIDAETGDTIIRLVNLTPATVKTQLGISGDASLTILTGKPDDLDSREQQSNISIIDGSYIQPPYSFSVLRFKNNR